MMRDRIGHERWPASAAAGLYGVLVLLVFSGGCGTGGPPLPEGAHVQRITGKVVMGNGDPVGRGKVVLTPQQQPSEPLSGWLDTDGSFILMENQGLAISHGEFLVHIEPLTPPSEPARSSQAKARPARLQKGQQIPTKYQKSETSKIKVTIGPDTTQLAPIVLK